MREVGERRAIRREPRIVEAVAVDETGALGRVDPDKVRGRMSGTRHERDALRGHRPEAEPHGAPENGRVIVHGRQDQRIGESHAAQAGGEARIAISEEGKEIEGQEPQAPLTQGHRDALGQAGEDAAVEHTRERIGDAHHGGWGHMVS